MLYSKRPQPTPMPACPTMSFEPGCERARPMKAIPCAVGNRGGLRIAAMKGLPHVHEFVSDIVIGFS